MSKQAKNSAPKRLTHPVAYDLATPPGGRHRPHVPARMPPRLTLRDDVSARGAAGRCAARDIADISL
jgi:hypothetical protein